MSLDEAIRLEREIARLRTFHDYVERVARDALVGNINPEDACANIIETAARICTEHGESEAEADEFAESLKRP